MDLALWTCAQSYWNRKGPSPKFGDIAFVLVCWSITIWPSPVSEKQPHDYPSSTKLYGWHNAVWQVSFYWHPPNPVSLHRTGFHCSRVQLCFIPLHLMLDVVLNDVRLAFAWQWKPIPWSSHKTVFMLILIPSLEVWNSSAMNQQSIGNFYTPHIQWLYLSCCCNTIYTWPWNI